MTRRPYEPPQVRDHTRRAAPVWVRVEPYAALISYPARHRRGEPYVPTWLVLGPLPAGVHKPRPTVGSGRVRIVEGGGVELELLDGELPEVIRAALNDAAYNLVWARS